MSPVAPLPPHERERLDALHALSIIDTPPEERFERLVSFTSYKLEVPIVVISLVDTERQWFKSCLGLGISETPRDVSFCAYAILQDEVMTVPDAREDERFADNALVTGPPFIRFYAGYPLREPHGYKIGTLCVIDLKPRQIDQPQIQLLKRVARLVEREVRMTVTPTEKKDILL